MAQMSVMSIIQFPGLAVGAPPPDILTQLIRVGGGALGISAI